VDIGAFEYGSILFVEKGDLDNNGEIEMDDAILAIMVMSNIAVPVPIFKEADINNDGVIGLEEAIYALQVLSETRP
jgi:hypothetical protein